MSFNTTTCTACLEVDTTKDYSSMVEGFKHLYDCGSVQSEQMASKIMNMNNNPFEILSTFRHYDVKGVSKCTETTLLSLDICAVPLKPVRLVECTDVIVLDDERTGSVFRVDVDGEDYSYEFSA
jgi:hypothetical protein